MKIPAYMRVNSYTYRVWVYVGFKAHIAVRVLLLVVSRK